MNDVIQLHLKNEETIKLTLHGNETQSLLLGAGSGTRNYENLYNKPWINGQEVIGEMTVGAICKTTAEWDLMPDYVPELGAIIVYLDHRKDESGADTPGVKIGDGMAYLIDLPFCGEDFTKEVADALEEHVMNTIIHVSVEDRERWDNKLNYNLSGETLVLNRL